MRVRTIRLASVGIALVATIAAVWAAPSVPAEDPGGVLRGTRIESEGAATVDASPSYVEFWLHLKASSATIVEAVQGVSGLDASLRAAAADRELAPLSILVSSPAVASMDPPEAKASAQVLFDATRFANLETGPREFAGLCDKVAALAKSLDCTVEGPIFTVADPDVLEQNAVARAVENALPAAEGAAQVMGGYLALVENVEVTSVAWSPEADSRVPQPEIRRVSCTAKVRVVYSFAPLQR